MVSHRAPSLSPSFLQFSLMICQITSATEVVHSDHTNNFNQLITRVKETLPNAKTHFLNSGRMLNSNKTQFILIGTRQLLSSIRDDMTINFDGNNLPISKNVKILCVQLDRHMTFDAHIHELNKKVSGVIMFINRVKDIFDKDTRITVIKTLVLSLINYGLKTRATPMRPSRSEYKNYKTSLPK